jgi:hypothetical protein
MVLIILDNAYKYLNRRTMNPNLYKVMKNLFILILACSLGTMAFSQENKKIEISKDVINSFQKNDFAKILSFFDETMKTALPVEKCKLVWNDLNSQCGKYQKYSTITEGKIQNYDIVYVLCHFEKVKLQMKVVFNDKNQVAGLFFIPENQK